MNKLKEQKLNIFKKNLIYKYKSKIAPMNDNEVNINLLS